MRLLAAVLALPAVGAILVALWWRAVRREARAMDELRRRENRE